MNMESPEARAKQAIDDKLGTEFEEKFDKVKPFLKERGLLDDNAKNEVSEIVKMQEIQERKDQDQVEIQKIRDSIVEKPNTIAQELNMFSPEKINERAQNRMSFMPKTSQDQWSDKAKEVLRANENIISGNTIENFATDDFEVANEKTPQEKRAENVLGMIENGKLNTHEKRVKNILNLKGQIETRDQERAQKKTRAQQLSAWWKKLNGNSN